MKLLDNTQTAEMIGIKPTSLEIWRVQGRGPAFIKVGRLVRYDEAQVVSWLESQTRTSTSDNRQMASA